MKKTLLGFALFVSLILAPASGRAATEERWLHVKVDGTGDNAEYVRINLPLSLAEKVLPTINHDKLRGGKVKITGDIKGIDLHALMEAVRSAGDSDFITVENPHENVRVAKSGGFLLIQVRETGKVPSKVDIRMPVKVVEALLSAGEDELDIIAAIRVLKEAEDTDLVSVDENSQTVRIWIDSRNTSK